LELLETRRTTRINRKRQYRAAQREEFDELKKLEARVEESGGALEPNDAARLTALRACVKKNNDRQQLYAQAQRKELESLRQRKVDAEKTLDAARLEVLEARALRKEGRRRVEIDKLKKSKASIEASGGVFEKHDAARLVFLEAEDAEFNKGQRKYRQAMRDAYSMLVQRNTEGKLSTPEATRLKSLQETKDKYRKADCLGKQRDRDTLKELSNAKAIGEVLSTEQIQKWELLDARRLKKNAYDSRLQAKRRKEKKHLFSIGPWTSEEHEAFLQGLEVHGRDWVKIATLIPSRSNDQIRRHARTLG
jgi:hypothetical protein